MIAMEAILARRYAFCDFSHIAGFPNLVPDREMWEYCLLKFSGNEFDHHAEHLFDFHECMQRMSIFHDDVLIKMFRNSLEGKAREWCKTLPAASITSLSDFHTVFYSHYKGMYSTEFSIENCCEIFKSSIQSKVDISLCNVDNKEADVEEINDKGSLINADNDVEGDIPALFQTDYSVMNSTEIIDGHFGFLDKSEFCCDFHDSVAIYMESVFSKSFRFHEAFQINTKCKYRYKLLVECLLQKNSVFCKVLSTGKKEDYVISQMLLWLHWKYHVT